MGVIETNGLTKRYGSVSALDGLDLQVEEGEVFGFLGPNGAGKTTTIDLLLDFIRPTEGSATILGYDPRTESDAIREHVGVLPDGFDLWGRSSGYRHLEFAIDSKDGTETPEELLSRVGLDAEDAERKVGDYSKGMVQRLAMAMALVGDPDILILDEPSSGLDPNGIRTMQNLVRGEADSGTTVFFSSHILGQVSAVCDRVAILDAGELVTVDTIEGLRTDANVGSKLLLRTDGEPAVEPATLEGIDGIEAVEIGGRRVSATYTDAKAKAQVITRVVESGTTVLDFETEEATLEDLFAAYTNTDASSVAEEQAEGGRIPLITDGGTPATHPEGGR